MSLSSLQIDAFLAVCESGGFTSAAKKLNITQSALSQRIKNLEDDLGSALFLRESSGIRTTDLGEKLLRYGKTKEALEDEFLRQVRSKGAKGLRGIVRVAGFSTVTRSIVVPLLSKLALENPELQIESKTAELSELPSLLSSGAADFVLVTSPIRRDGIENDFVGHERNVLVRRKTGESRDDVYLDHDENDATTLEFFSLQGERAPKKFKRAYLDDIDSIITGVETGMGRAIAPVHLVDENKRIEVVGGMKTLKVPVHLAYFAQSYYSELHLAVRDVLKTGVTKALKH